MPPAQTDRLSVPLVLALPEDRTAITGGNLYNRLLLNALESTGIETRAADLEKTRALLGQRQPGIYLVDSLLLENLPELTVRPASGQHIFVLAHYLPSMEPRHSSPAAVAHDQALLKGADGFVVTSHFMRDRIIARYSEGRPVLVVPPALVLVPSGRDFARRMTGDGQFRGLVVANLSPVKGVLELLRSLASLLVESDRFTLEIAGRLDLDPVYAQSCQRVVEGSPNLKYAVRLRGVLGPDLLREAYLGSTVFISASEMETYGMAVQEAVAFGVPVLALDAGNLRNHLSSGNRGRLFGSVEDLAKGCIELIRDDKALGRLGRAAFENRPFERYSWNDAARSLVAQLRRWAQ